MLGSEKQARHSSGLTSRAAPLAALAIFVLGVWLVAGVDLGDALRFAGYELIAVLLPGVLLWLALRGPGRVGAVDLAIGAPLGFGVEILGFALAGELSSNAIQYGIQLCVALGGAAIVWRHRSAAPPPPSELDGSAAGGQFGWWVAAVAGCGVAAIAVASFTQTPLPGTFAQVSYFQDLVFQLGLAAEALHHWPITDPKVAGEGLPYHTFVDIHLASASRATGVELPIVLFRLYLVPLLCLVVLQLSVLGNLISGRRWVGPLAAALLIFAGELDPSSDQAFVFLNTTFFSLHASPSFLFALPFFLAAIGLICSLVTPRRAAMNCRGHWIALVLVLAAVSGAKATVLPVLAGGLAIHIGVRRLIDGRLDRPATGAFVLCAAIFVLSYVLIYRGETGGLVLDVPGSVDLMRPTELVRSALDGPLGVFLWPAAVIVGIAGFCGVLLGGMVVGARARCAWLTPWRTLLLGLFACGFIPFLLFQHPGSSQNFFTYNSLVAGTILAADGIVSAYASLDHESKRRGLAAASWTAAGVATLTLSAIAVFGPGAEPRLYALAALVVAASIAAWLAMRRAATRRRLTWGAAIPVAAILSYGMLDAPLDVAPDLIARAGAGKPLYAQEGRGLSADLLEGMVWLRENTGESTVLAVNNQFLDEAEENPGYMYYSAFAERRVFLEGWGYALETSRIGVDEVLAGEVHPFPDRLELNRAVFELGDESALRELTAERGVDFLIVDLVNGGPSPALGGLDEPVFANDAVEVYDAARLAEMVP